MHYKKYKLSGGVIPNITEDNKIVTIYDKFINKTLIRYENSKYYELFNYSQNNSNTNNFVCLNENFNLEYINKDIKKDINIIYNNIKYNDIVDFICKHKYIKIYNDNIYSDILLLDKKCILMKHLSLFIYEAIGKYHNVDFLRDHFNVVEGTNGPIYLGITKKYNILSHYLFINKLKEFLSWGYRFFSEYDNEDIHTFILKKVNDNLDQILNDLYECNNIFDKRLHNIEDYMKMTMLLVEDNNRNKDKINKYIGQDMLFPDDKYKNIIVDNFKYLVSFIIFSRKLDMFEKIYKIKFDHLVIFSYINNRLITPTINRPDIPFEILPINTHACLNNLFSNQEKTSDVYMYDNWEDIKNQYIFHGPNILTNFVTIYLENCDPFANCVESAVYQLVKFLAWNWKKHVYNLDIISTDFTVFFLDQFDDLNVQFSEKINKLDYLLYVNKINKCELETNIKNFIILISKIFNIKIDIDNANNEYEKEIILNNFLEITKYFKNKNVLIEIQKINELNDFIISANYNNNDIKIVVNPGHAETEYKNNNSKINKYFNKVISNIYDIHVYSQHSYNQEINDIVKNYSEKKDNCNVCFSYLYYIIIKNNNYKKSNDYESYNFKFFKSLSVNNAVSYFMDNQKLVEDFVCIFYKNAFNDNIDMINYLFYFLNIKNFYISKKFKLLAENKYNVSNFYIEKNLKISNFESFFILILFIHEQERYDTVKKDEILDNLNDFIYSNVFKLIKKWYSKKNLHSFNNSNASIFGGIHSYDYSDEEIFLFLKQYNILDESKNCIIYTKIKNIIINYENEFKFLFPTVLKNEYNSSISLEKLNDNNIIINVFKHYYNNFSQHEKNYCYVVTTLLETLNNNLHKNYKNYSNEWITSSIFYQRIHNCNLDNIYCDKIILFQNNLFKAYSFINKFNRNNSNNLDDIFDIDVLLKNNEHSYNINVNIIKKEDYDYIFSNYGEKITDFMIYMAYYIHKIFEINLPIDDLFYEINNIEIVNSIISFFEEIYKYINYCIVNTIFPIDFNKFKKINPSSLNFILLMKQLIDAKLEKKNLK